MPLHKASKRLLTSLETVEDIAADVDTVRAQAKASQHQWDVPQFDVWSEEDELVLSSNGDVPIRIYRPVGPKEDSQLPIIVTYHGGATMNTNATLRSS